MSILIEGGGTEYLQVNQSPDIESDYTWIGWAIFSLAGGNNQDVINFSELANGGGDRDHIALNYGSDKVELECIGGTGAPGTTGEAGTISYGTWYKFMLRRSGTTVSVWRATAGNGLAQIISVTAGNNGDRAAAAYTSIGFGGAGGNGIRVAAYRVYSGRALTNGEADTELDYWPTADTTSLWAAWRLESDGTYSDLSGNGRTLTETGTLSTDASNPTLDEPPAGSAVRADYYQHLLRRSVAT